MRYALAEAVADFARDLAIVACCLSLGAAVYRLGLDGSYDEGYVDGVTAVSTPLEDLLARAEDDGSEPA